MSQALLQAYHRLPAPLRSMAATVRGAYLRSWRYGPETERLIEEAQAREGWTAEQWQRWQGEQLARVLHRAATRVPYYRELWAARRRAGDKASWDSLAAWPILEKDALRAQPKAFVADDRDIRRMFHEHTSGTTGKSLDLWWSRHTVRAWYALLEARCRRWYGVSRHDRWAILGGQLVTPVANRRPPFWVWNAALHQLYMSSYHLAPALMGSYLEALARYRVTHLLGYTSALHSLAQEVLRQGRRDLTMKVAITNAEPVLDHQREAIAEAFGCTVCETYGQSEIVACASECAHGTLHTWPEVGVIEILSSGALAAPGVAGDLIGTSLMNDDMPLIRYQLGDAAAPADPTSRCACGRTLPALARIEGRADDVLYTRDGRRIGRLDPVFKANLPVLEAQIIQEAVGRVRVRYVPAPDFNPAAATSIAERLRDRLGETDIVFEETSEIPRTSRGKFRAVICEIPAAERQRLAAL